MLFQDNINDQWFGCVFYTEEKFNSVNVPPYVVQAGNAAKNYVRENPVTSLVLLSLCGACAIPVLVFLAFAVITILVTFAGFLFVEGEKFGIFIWMKLMAQIVFLPHFGVYNVY